MSCLIISPESAHFDIVELAHRVELELDELPTRRAVWDLDDEDATAWAKEAQRLLGKPHEVIVLANAMGDSISEDFRGALFDRVREGQGLVFIRFGEDAANSFSPDLESMERVDVESTVLRGVGHAIVPGLTDIATTLRCYQSAGGRVVDIHFPEKAPDLHSLFPSPVSLLNIDKTFRDSYYGLIVRAMEWAAAREYPNRIESVEFLEPITPDLRDVPPFLPKEYVAGLFEKSNAQALETVNIRLDRPAVRDYRIGVRPSYPFRMLPSWSLVLPRALKRGETRYTFQTPLSQGDFFLDLWLEGGKGTVDWYRKTVHASSWPKITEFQCLRTVLLPNDTAEVSFKIEPNALEPRNCLVMARGTDALGRVVAEKYLSVGGAGGPVRMTLDFVDLIASYVRIEVYAMDVEGYMYSSAHLERAGYASLYLPVRRDGTREFHFIADGLDSLEYNARSMHAVLRKAGVDTLATGPSTGNGLGPYLDSLHALPTVGSYVGKALEGWERDPCLSDPNYLSRQDEAIRVKAQAYWAYGPSFYFIDDRAALAPGGEALCRSLTCLKGFEVWLRNTYFDLEALGASWGRPFGSYEEASRFIPNSPTTENRRYAAGIDFQRYMGEVFAEALYAGARAVRAVDRRARVGFGIETSGGALGLDWRGVASRFDALGIDARSEVVEMLRSFQSAGSSHLIRTGEISLSESMGRWLPWYAVLHGMGGVWLENAYATSSESDESTALTSSGEMSPGMSALSQSMAELKAGVAAVLRNARRVKPEIAVYYSHPSVLLGQVDDVFGCQALEAAASFQRILERLGYQYDVVSSDEATRGELEDYELVVLPMIRALSGAEVEALRGFHEGGGALIADLSPGDYDDHGARRVYPPMAHVFGVVQNGPSSGVRSDETSDEFLSGATRDASVEARGAATHAIVNRGPVWFVRDDGPGFTVLLNHTVKGLENSSAFRDALEGWIVSTNVSKTGASLLEKKLRFEGERVEFEFGSARVLALLASPGEKRVKFPATFKRGMHVYDMRIGTKLSREKASLRLEPGEAGLFAILPYEVTSISLEAAEVARAGRRLSGHIALRTRGGLPGRHVVHVSLAQKNGNALQHYEQNVVCVGGQGDFYIPLALNEGLGLYDLTARDVLSGVTTTVRVRVTR